MPLPNFVAQTDIFFTWLDATNNLTSHVDNTSAYLLVAQNATPRTSSGNIALSGTFTLGTTVLNTSALVANGNFLTTLNASAITTGTLPLARLNSNVILTTSTTGMNASALSTGTVPNARLDATVLLTTSTTGINASALSTGTVPIARLDANVLLTTSTTGINASALSTGIVPTARLTSASVTDTGVVTTTTQSFAGNKTFVNSVTISGNLNVLGTTTTVSANNLIVDDSLIQLAANNTTSDLLDIGLYGNYNNDGGTHEHTGLFRDATDGLWKLFVGLQDAPTSTINTSGVGYAIGTIQTYLTSGGVVANSSGLTVTANNSYSGTLTVNTVTAQTLTGNLTGTASNATNLNSQPGSFYTNASNLNTGTVAIARLDANVILTTSTTGINASALSTGTVPLARLTSANSSANGVVDTNTQTFAGLKTFSGNATFSGSRTFFTSGSVLDWNSGDVTVTHAADTLTFSGASTGYVFNDGPVTLAAGAVGTPSLTTNGDLNTGLYFPAADTLAMVAGGTEVMRVNGVNGNIGIGTSNPTASMKLDVRAPLGQMSLTSTTGTNTVRYIANNDGGTLYVGLDSSTGGNFSGTPYAAALWSTANAPMVFGCNNGEKLRLTSIGNIGMVATTKLFFDGTAATGDTYISESSANKLSFFAGGTESLSLTSSAANVSTTLGVTGTLTALGQLVVGANANFDSGVLFVDSINNRVGINNTAPTTALEVTGTVTATTFSGSGASLTALNASNLSTGTVPIARLDANVILTTSTTGINASALSTGTVPVGRLDSSVLLTTSTTGINASALSTGTVPVARLSSANTTAAGVVDTTTQSFAGNKTFTNDVTVSGTLTGTLTGTASNATNLNSQPGSYYTNASNLNTGTVPVGRLDSSVLLTTSTTGINASALSTGTVPLARLTSANSSANGVVDTNTQTFAGLKTFSGNATFSGSRTFFASGSVLDWNSGDVTLTHAADKLTIDSGSLAITSNVSAGLFTGLSITNITTDQSGVKTRISLPVFNGTTGGVIEEIGNSTDGYRLNIYQGQTNGSLTLGTGGDNVRLHIISSGNIGIGNTAPAHLLRVEGTTSINGALNALSTLAVTGATTLSSTLNVTGVATFSANANFDSGTLFVDGVNNRVGVNNTAPTTALEVTGTVTATTFSGSGASLTALNASALSTGTVPIARLDANVILTTSTTGINASALSTGTVPLARLTSANSSANGVVDTNAQTFAGVKTFSANTLFNDRVGIGTTSPQTSLHAYTSNADTGAGRTTPLDVLTIESENTGAVEGAGFGQGIVFRGSTYNNTTSRTLGRILHQINDDSINTTRGSSFAFQTTDNPTNGAAPTTKLTINYAGNIGIGNTTPAHLLRVEGTTSINGALNALSTLAVTGATTLSNTASISGALVAGASAAQTSFAITSGAYGSSTAGNRGVFAGYAVLGSSGGGYGTVGYNVRYTDTTNSYVYAGSDVAVLLDFNDGFTFKRAASNTAGSSITFSDLARITNAGKVGIGNTAPSEKVQIDGNINLGGGANRYIKFDTSSAWYYYLASSGNDFRLYDADNTDFIKTFYGSGTTTKYVSLLSALHVKNDGNIGLGNTSPAHKLRVEGTTSINGALNALSTLAVTGATTLSNTVSVAGATNALSTLGVTGTLTALGLSTLTGNATFSGSRTFFASGSVLDWNSGDVTVTHAANTLTFAGASTGYVFNDGPVTLAAGAVGTPSLTTNGDLNTGLYFPAADTIAVTTAGSERLRIGSGGNVQIGATASASYNYGTPMFSVASNSYTAVSVAAHDDTASVNASYVGLMRSRGTQAAPTNLLAGDVIGSLMAQVFNASGSFPYRASAAIAFEADFNHASGDLPGRIRFSTVSAGTVSLTERLRITSGGNLAIGATAKLFLDGVAATGDTYISESSANKLSFVAGGTESLSLTSSAANVSTTLGVTGATTLSSTLNVTGVATFSANANFDSGTLFVDGVNNRVGIGSTAPTQTVDIVGGAIIRNRTASAGLNKYEITKFVSGTGATNALQLTIPAESVFVFIKMTFSNSRATNASVGTSYAGARHFAIARNGSGADVVLDTNVGSQDWTGTTTTAGGSISASSAAATIVRNGAETNTSAQVVNITFDPQTTAGSTGLAICQFEIFAHSATEITIT